MERDIYNEIIEIIKNTKYIRIPISYKSNLYIDLGFDSIDFIKFLIKIEEVYSIDFDIIEMEMCLQVGKLIELIEVKIKECDSYNQIIVN